MADAASIIDAAQAYAATIQSSATGALADAKNAINGIPSISLAVIPIPIPDFTPIAMPVSPVVVGVTLDLPAEPATPTGLATVNASIDTSELPSLSAVLGAMLNPSVPSDMADFNGVAPTIDLSAAFPDVPPQLSAVLNPPTFTDHAVPVAPDVVIPIFSESAPTDITQDPGDYTGALMNTFSNVANSVTTQSNGLVDTFVTRFCPQFNSQMSALEAKLAQYVVGGSAVDVSVENAIFERDKEKQNAEYKRTASAARNQAAKWGFTVPGGYVVNALQVARQSAADNNARASREVAITVYAKEQENVQFALTQSKEVRLNMIQSANSYFNSLTAINNMALDAGKAVMESMVEIYNGLIKRYEISLEAYKTDAAVYETKVRGATAVIELYKAEIEALQALTEVDKTKVDIYRSQVDTLQAFASVYKTQVDAVVSKAQLQRLQIDVFGAQVEAYKAQLSGKGMQWEGYKAALESNDTTAKIYMTQVDAFGKQVDAYGSVIRAKSTALDGEVRANEAIVRQYESQVNAFRTIVSARGDVAHVELDINRQVLDNYKAQLEAALAEANSAAVYHKLLSDTKITQAEQQMKTEFKQADLWMQKSEDIAKLSESLAGIYASSAQGAINGINSLVTLAG